MSFRRDLKRALEREGMLQKELSERSGVSQKMISEYMHGTEPTEAARQKIESVIKIEPDPLETEGTKKRYSIEQAAKDMGIPLAALKDGLIQEKIHPQVGWAALNEKHYSYVVFEERVKAYVQALDIKGR